MTLWQEKRLPVSWRWLLLCEPSLLSQALSIPVLTTAFTAPLHEKITWNCQEWLTVTHQWIPVNQQDLPPSGKGLSSALWLWRKRTYCMRTNARCDFRICSPFSLFLFPSFRGIWLYLTYVFLTGLPSHSGFCHASSFESKHNKLGYACPYCFAS